MNLKRVASTTIPESTYYYTEIDILLFVGVLKFQQPQQPQQVNIVNQTCMVSNGFVTIQNETATTTTPTSES